MRAKATVEIEIAELDPRFTVLIIKGVRESTLSVHGSDKSENQKEKTNLDFNCDGYYDGALSARARGFTFCVHFY